MKKINLDIKYLFLIWGLLIAALISTYAHHGNLIVDCGREAYYSAQVAQGKVLYKDIFNIYGPFSYMYNAFLFKIFGINLNILYLSGFVSTFFIVSLTYLIARRFMNEFTSFSISAFTIIIGVVNTNLFNTIFPYSYGMLYGVAAVLISLLLLLKYEELPERNSYLYLSAFFAGLCVASKYEFLPYFLVILYGAIKIKRLNFKQYGLLLLSLFSVPLVCFGTLFLQGLRVDNLIQSALIVNKMAHTKVLTYFYQHVGVFFHKKTLPLLIWKFFEVLVPLALFFGATRVKNKIFSIILAIIAAFLVFHNTFIEVFAFLPVLISIWFIFNFKNIYNNTRLMILTLSSILLCMKLYWGLILLSYGDYLISLPLITIITLISDKFKDKKINPQIFSSFLLLTSIPFILIGINDLKNKTDFISTQRGKFYLEKPIASATNTLIKYIQTKTKKSDTVVIFPEGQLINFLTDRKSDDIYGSLIPLYIETFGEGKIITHFRQTKPEYIIFNNWDYKGYYFEYICNDYAQAFCSFVAQNYTQEKVIDDGFRYLIFKRKK